MVQILSSPFLELPRLELEEYLWWRGPDLNRSDWEHLEEATDSELPLKVAELMEEVLGGAMTELEEEMVESLLPSSWLEKEERVLAGPGLAWLAQPLSRLHREDLLALLGLKSWGEPALLGVETSRTCELWELWELCSALLAGWKELCLAASLYSGRGSHWTVDPPDPP